MNKKKNSQNIALKQEILKPCGNGDDNNNSSSEKNGFSYLCYLV